MCETPSWRNCYSELELGTGKWEMTTCSLGGAQEIQFRALADGLAGVRCARESNHPALLTLGEAKLFSDRE
jgi:hypothetical protein